MKTKKRISPAERAAKFKPTYFFGYGSLLIPEGINGRGMYHKYVQADLAAAMLGGYERGMSAFFGGRNFYGLLENKSARCNGIAFKINDWYDYRALLRNEGATSDFKAIRTYWPVDVTKNIINWDVPKGHRVITLVGKEDKSNHGRVQASYIRFCHHAASQWSKEFLDDFLETGGIPYKFGSMKAIAKQHSIKLW
ncbi:MAG TPA: gamma-glutamylcyclotransferase family protein [Desulfosporosinus sp.]|nr:gamma-glutamylcyclotransferase family protein [Desulfosporosinus sp.]